MRHVLRSGLLAATALTVACGANTCGRRAAPAPEAGASPTPPTAAVVTPPADSPAPPADVEKAWDALRMGSPSPGGEAPAPSPSPSASPKAGSPTPLPI